MILYLDTNVLVKRYVTERGTGEVQALLQTADLLGTSEITRVEVVAVFMRAYLGGNLSGYEANAVLESFLGDWADYVRVPADEPVLTNSTIEAWAPGLRGYDAVHLASAIELQSVIGDAVTVASFDEELWMAAGAAGLAVWPADDATRRALA